MSWANDPGVADNGIGLLQHDYVELLVPAERITEFRDAVSPALAQDIQMALPPDVVWLEGKEYTLVALPAERLEDLYEEIADKAFHKEIEVVLSEEEGSVAVTGLPTVARQLGMEAPSTPTETT